ncbi:MULTISPECIES: molybdate ABC transporter substrate-binding protein [Halomonas]|uniref:Molybdate transport system substrate-binding protein n=1 Tax=Halomonas ventosae TaxID=229007 RepID=A0A4R6H8M1_9GAMM|nr:molybdate ABC transporter substrate-binding protein [Halomonas ventosae]TDO04600.1 molybdate transport system substrate-binding protein [Halomonas ventosae]
MFSFLRWAFFAWLVLTSPAVLAEPPIVAAASSLQFVMPELAERFQAQGGAAMRVNYGASGNLSRQIAQGAPFALFLSADEQSVLTLYEAGLTKGAGVIYAVGRLAWLQPAERGDLPPGDAPLSAVREAIDAYRAGQGRPRIALANPEHAPYGVAARQALQHAGLWDAVAPLRLLGENVSQAARFALADEARGGLVAYSLALAPAVAEQAEHRLIPADWHAPLRQRMVLMPAPGDSARAFYDWLQGQEAGAVFARFGFQPPGDVDGR